MSSWQVEVLSVGTWNGDRFARTDLQELADNFARLHAHLRVPLKFGHADGQTLLGQADGDPALGWVTGVQVQGDRLLATFSHVPAVVRQAVEANLYRRVSSEIAYDVRYQGRRIGKVLVGVALLGADLPAVSNLADLGAYLSARGLTQRRVYAFNLPARGQPPAPAQHRRAMTEPFIAGTMPETGPEPGPAPGPEAGAHPGPDSGLEPTPEPAARLTADLQQARAEVEHLRQREAGLRQREAGLRQQETELRQQETQLREQEARLHEQDSQQLEQARSARFAQARRDFSGALDDLVRAGRLEPHARDEALVAMAGQAAEFQTELRFSAGLVRRLLQGSGPLPQGETGAGATLRDLAGTDGPLELDELQREVARLTATGHYSVGEAQAHLLATDKRLAARWMQAVNQTLPPEVQS